MIDNVLAFANPPKYDNGMNAHHVEIGQRAEIQLALGDLLGSGGLLWLRESNPISESA